MRTTSTKSTLSVLFVLLAACGDGRAPSTDHAPSPRASVVAPATATAAPATASPVAASGTDAAVSIAAPATASTRVPASPAAPTAGFRVVAATFTHGVEARRPVDEARSFAVGERATLHLVVENLAEPRDVTVEWFRGETVLGRTTLEVGTSPAWRTWAARRVTIRDAGIGVSARVLDADGTVLRVEQAAVTSSAPAA